MLGTLIAATALSVVLAVVGLLTALLGGARDERASCDLSEQGVGPRGLRAELRVRLALASVLGVIVGLGIAVLLTRLAVASVRAAGTVADPSPPVVTVVPWAELAAWGAGTLAVLALAGALATRALIGRRRPMSEAVVELRDVFCVHRTNEGDAAALAGTNLELGRGEVLCVLGPSGAGKSTLLRVVAGLQQPSAGVVRVLGRDISRMPARSRCRGSVTS